MKTKYRLSTETWTNEHEMEYIDRIGSFSVCQGISRTRFLIGYIRGLGLRESFGRMNKQVITAYAENALAMARIASKEKEKTQNLREDFY